jgi:hypothetical protein
VALACVLGILAASPVLATLVLLAVDGHPEGLLVAVASAAVPVVLWGAWRLIQLAHNRVRGKVGMRQQVARHLLAASLAIMKVPILSTPSPEVLRPPPAVLGRNRPAEGDAVGRAIWTADALARELGTDLGLVSRWEPLAISSGREEFLARLSRARVLARGLVETIAAIRKLGPARYRHLVLAFELALYRGYALDLERELALAEELARDFLAPGARTRVMDVLTSARERAMSLAVHLRDPALRGTASNDVDVSHDIEE